MKQTIFTGSGVALVTPMKITSTINEINYDVLEQLIEYQISHGTDACIIAGTTGEASTLSEAEYKQLIKEAVHIVNGRIPLIAGSGSNNTATAVYRSILAKEAGADALLIVTPYYNKTSQSGLIKHFTACADAAKLPVILYNVPSRTGVTIAPKTCLTLSKNPYITAIKEASGNIALVTEIASLCEDKLDIYSGNDDQIVPLLSLGGKGVISVLANLLPQETHEICQLFFDGNLEKSRELQLKFLPLIKALFADINPIPIKYALNQFQFEVGSCRPPLYEIEANAKECLQQALKPFLSFQK